MPPSPHLGTGTLPLQHRDVLGVAIVLLAVLVAAEQMTRGGMDVASGQGVHLGVVGHRPMAEPADPHGRGVRRVAHGSSIAVGGSWVTVAPFPPLSSDPPPTKRQYPGDSVPTRAQGALGSTAPDRQDD